MVDIAFTKLILTRATSADEIEMISAAMLVAFICSSDRMTRFLENCDMVLYLLK